MTSILCLWLLLLFVSSTQASKLFRVTFEGQEDSKKFEAFAIKNNIDVWGMSKDFADVAVQPDEESKLKTNYPNAELKDDDLEKSAEKQNDENEQAKKNAGKFRTIYDPATFFARYDEIIIWMKDLARNHDFVSLYTIGKTFEGRDMVIARIGPGDHPSKPGILITAGYHAREWLGVATTTYFIRKLFRAIRFNEERIMKLVAKYDFYVSPVTNPDGYEYSHLNSRTRFWRKTRSRRGHKCVGVDPNRNFDVNFGGEGASPDPCSYGYSGPHAFSENCTRNLRDFVRHSRGRFKLYYDVHAYGQYYLVPFNYDRFKKPDDDVELRRVAKLSNNRLLAKNGRKFQLGSCGELLYPHSGAATDYLKLYEGVKYAYILEVFPSFYLINTLRGFLAGPSHIEASGEEIYEGIITAAENIKV